MNKTKATGRLMQYLTDEGNPDLSIKLYEQNPKTTESTWQYLRALKKTNQKIKLEIHIKDGNPNGKILYLQAWLNEISNPKKATILYKNALMLSPLYEEGVTDAISFLKDKQSTQETYDILLTSVMLNQYSVVIQKAYTLQSIESNYFNFADYSLNKLKILMDKSQYQAFAKEVALRKEKKLNEIEWK